MAEKKKSSTSKHHFWTTENATRLIELYENHPCLYDAKSRNYHNRNLKAKALTKICDDLKELFPDKPFTEALIKSKIHTLRSQFMSELNKIKKSASSGASPDDIYKPTLWCYQSLQFLEDSCEVVTEGDSNLEQEQDNTQDSDADGSVLLVDARVEELSSQFSLDEYCSPSASTSRSAASVNRDVLKRKHQLENNVNKLQTPSKKPEKKKRKLEDDEYAGILRDCSTAINNLRSASPPVVEPKENENSLFGKYITSEMNNITNDAILDKFKENVMTELFAAKKFFRQQSK